MRVLTIGRVMGDSKILKKDWKINYPQLLIIQRRIKA
jgi:hypothetical protein